VVASDPALRPCFPARGWNPSPETRAGVSVTDDLWDVDPTLEQPTPESDSDPPTPRVVFSSNQSLIKLAIVAKEAEPGRLLPSTNRDGGTMPQAFFDQLAASSAAQVTFERQQHRAQFQVAVGH